MLTRFCEINAYSVFIRIPLRTPVVLILLYQRKTAPLKAFRQFGFFPAKKISSQPRYDHFDTSPYMLTRFCEVNAYSVFIWFFVGWMMASFAFSPGIQKHSGNFYGAGEGNRTPI